MFDDIPMKSPLDVIQAVDSIVRNSVPNNKDTLFYVPRVRISFKDLERCLVVIYTSAEKFLRLEFLDKFGEVIVHRLESSYDQDDIITEKVTDTSPVALASCALDAVLIHQKALLGTLEIEFSISDKKTQTKILKEMSKTLRSGEGQMKNVLQTRKIVYNYLAHVDIVSNFHEHIIDMKVLKETAIEGISFRSESVSIRKVFDSTDFQPENKTQSCTKLEMSGYQTGDMKLCLRNMPQNGFSTCRLLEKSEFHRWDTLIAPVTRLNNKVQTKRVVLEPKKRFVVRWNKSKCGVWFHMVHVNDEKDYLKFFESETCGLRYYCEKCSDPFDHWFYQNIPRRVYYEPQWTDIGYRPKSKQDMTLFLRTLRSLREMIREEVKKELADSSHGVEELIDDDYDDDENDDGESGDDNEEENEKDEGGIDDKEDDDDNDDAVDDEDETIDFSLNLLKKGLIVFVIALPIFLGILILYVYF